MLALGWGAKGVTEAVTKESRGQGDTEVITEAGTVLRGRESDVNWSLCPPAWPGSLSPLGASLLSPDQVKSIAAGPDTPPEPEPERDRHSSLRVSVPGVRCRHLLLLRGNHRQHTGLGPQILRGAH